MVLDTIEFGAKIKKTPVVVGNCTGFAVNRVFFPYTQAACLLVDIGLDPYMVDKVIAMGFGMPMGPFRSAPHCATSTSCYEGSFILYTNSMAKDLRKPKTLQKNFLALLLSA